MTSENRLRDPVYIGETIIERGLAWADADAAASLLEETKKPRLSQIMQRHLEAGSAANKAEALALASPEYGLHIHEMVTARQAANRAKVSWEGSKIMADLMRSAESTRRAEMGLR